MSYDYEDSLTESAKQRYKSKLEVVGLEKCPNKFRGDLWENNPKAWPHVEYPDVYHYLIKFPRVYSSEAMENYKSLDSYKFFVSGWVQTVYHIEVKPGNMVFRADVRPSYRVTEDPHHPWIALKKNGTVIAGHCDCMAGLGETCSHVGALLFKIEAAVRLGYTSSTCTDEPCQWNQCFTNNVQPSEVSSVRFYKEETREKIKGKKKKLIEKPSVTEEEVFLNALAAINPNIVGLSAFHDYTDHFVSRKLPPPLQQMPEPLRNLYSSRSFESDEQFQTHCDNIFDNLTVTDNVSDYVSEVTVGQSASLHWYNQRAGRITSSTSHDLLHTNVLNPAPSLIKRICSDSKSQLTVPAICWGNNNEDNAFLHYSSIIGAELYSSSNACSIIPTGEVFNTLKEVHEDVIVCKSGLHISTTHPYLGASPDGIITCACHGKGVLEIKCPFKHKESKLGDMLLDKGFCLNSELQLKPTHKYYSQVQLQMSVCNAEYTHFVIWTPIDTVITQVEKDEPFITNMLSTFQLLWKQAILPELVTRRLELQPDRQDVPIASTSTDHTTDISADQTSTDQVNSVEYCICRSTDGTGEMVGCDKCDEWFHLPCLKLKRFPRGKRWYCPACRKVINEENQ